MNYKEVTLNPSEIYEIIEIQMSKGDKISSYIIRRMKKEDVLDIIEKTKIPETKKDAMKEGNESVNIATTWFTLAKLIKVFFLPLVMFVFFTLFIGSFVTLILGYPYILSLRLMVFSGTASAAYMIFFFIGKSFFDLAVCSIIKTITILANIEHTGKMVV